MMVYIDDNIHQLDIEAALRAVSDERRQYALRYRHEHDQRLCLAAYLLLHKALKLECGIAELPQFTMGEHGKPTLVGHPDIHFNMSHCHGVVACAVSDQPVGIDVERIDRYDPDLLQRTMNAIERKLIAASADAATMFIRLWTMKESVLKLTGEGISRDLHTVLLHPDRYRFHTTIHPTYICTTCHHSLAP